MFPQIFGKYVLEREIARGGMARVLLATLRGAGGFEKRLVVKQIRPELASDQSFIGRFVAEAKTAVELSHANIVPVYELGAEQGTYYIAMEFCEGVPLSQLLSQGALSPYEGAYIGVEICRALDYAHRKAGIVHRDVTPRNVMVDREGMVRLIDFGIAAPAHTTSRGEPLFGSPGHMPPEQLRPGPLTPAADVFAVAALLVEAWTGEPPFRRESFEESQRALERPVPDLAAADPALAPLSSLLRSALALSPGERPQSAEELARPLREFLRPCDLGDLARRLGQRVSERLTGPPEPPPPALSETPRLGATPAGPPCEAGPGATQTFAARDALLEWTAKLDSQPPAPLARRPQAPARRATLFAMATALALAGLWGARWGSGSPAPRPAPEAAAAEASPAAVGAAPGATPTPSPPPSEPTPASATAAARPGSGKAANPTARGSTSPGAARGSTSPTAPTTPNSGAAASPPSRAGAALSAAAPSVAPGSTIAAAPRARVQVTSEPPALVQVDSVPMGRTPLPNLQLSPGRHEFVFVNELLGERLQTQLTLGATELSRVHADFTSATPQIYQR